MTDQKDLEPIEINVLKNKNNHYQEGRDEQNSMEADIIIEKNEFEDSSGGLEENDLNNHYQEGRDEQNIMDADIIFEKNEFEDSSGGLEENDLAKNISR